MIFIGYRTPFIVMPPMRDDNQNISIQTPEQSHQSNKTILPPAIFLMKKYCYVLGNVLSPQDYLQLNLQLKKNNKCLICMLFMIYVKIITNRQV